MALRTFIDRGTAGYPPKIARRLRAVNIAATIGAGLTASFAVHYALLPATGVWKLSVVNAMTFVLMASVPLLHRVGPRAGGIALFAVAYTAIFALGYLTGTDSGIYLYAVTTPALAILFFGVEEIRLAALTSAVSVAAILLLHLAAPSNTGLHSPTELFYSGFVPTVVASAALLFAIALYAMRQIARAEATAEYEHARSEELLSHILPPGIGERLKERGVIADRFENASILFADMAGFTARASQVSPVELVQFLNEVFGRFDRLVQRHGLEKIKTTGDSYMVASGVPAPRPDHAQALARFALDLRDAAAGLAGSVPLRIGMASGPVVAGVVGAEKFFYDVWGDAVNVASRMESTGEAGRIQVDPATYDLLKDAFLLEARGTIDVRGKGAMPTWFLTASRG